MLNKDKMKYMKNVLTEIVVMIISVSIIIFAAEKCESVSEDSYKKHNGIEKELTVWYNDKNYDNYFNAIAKEYEKVTGIKIKSVYVSDVDYLENINKANKNTDDSLGDAPDVYLIDSDELEAAYGYGLAAVNNDTVYNESNYAKTALDAVTFKGKYVAYPFSFDTAFMIYNAAYFKDAPDDFQSIVMYAKNFDSAKNPDISHILYFNAEDVFHNLGFVGNYLNVGGTTGDDKTKININSDEVKSAFKAYTELSKVFDVNILDDFSDISTEFMSGHIVCTIVNMEEFNQIRNYNNINGLVYKACMLPDISKDIKTKSVSCTDTFAVNYMSDKEQMAKDFAKYATYSRADMIYENTGYLPARNVNYMNEFYKVIKEQYDNSCSLPKLMVTNDYFIQLQSILNKAWQGEDISKNLDNMYEMYAVRMSE